jgi:hypothetical protein
MRLWLTLWLTCASVMAREPHPRATRATGIALTVLGAVNLVLVGAFAAVYATSSCGSDCSGASSDSATINGGIGISGMAVSGIVGSALLSVGIPLIVLAHPDGARVQLLPNGIRATF